MCRAALYGSVPDGLIAPSASLLPDGERTDTAADKSDYFVCTETDRNNLCFELADLSRGSEKLKADFRTKSRI